MKIVMKNVSHAAISAIFFASAATAQYSPPASTSNTYSYSDLADLALAAPVAVVVTVHDAVKLKGADAAGVSPNATRFYIEGDVNALLAGRSGLPASVSWLADVPMDSANRVPKLKKAKLILLARPIPGKSGTLQLVAKDAQIPWSLDAESRLRAILTEANGASVPPQITGVGHAFHVAGSIPGEGETQIFLKTADNRPVSLSILRRPGEDPRWSVALGEMVDDAAAAPQKDSLLWYRLACSLPPSLPDDAVSDQSPDDATQARADYQLVVQGLGACGRNRTAG
jgi:hypothetical protein